MIPTPTNVWTALSALQAVANGVPYIDPSTLQPAVDVSGHSYDSATQETGIKKLAVEQAIAGASGSIVLNTMAGVVQFAIAAQELTLTNDRIEADSIVIPIVQTDDVTAKSAVAHTILLGSCKIKLNAAATALTKVAFLILRTK